VPAIDIESDALCRLDRLARWFFWTLWASIVVIAAAFYYEKAADNRSAFVRWRPQVLEFWSGVNVYGDKMNFPTPPIMPITLYPLMILPTVTGAMCWFAIKVALTTATLIMCLDIVQPPGRLLPPMFRSLILILSLRPILGDLHHGNNNLVILFLIASMFYAWRRGYDLVAGLLLALAVSYKVTPALFFIYFAYKRSWRIVGWGAVGMVLFLLVVPGAIIGPEFNWECLTTWCQRMVKPFVNGSAKSFQESNQSFFGVLTRLLTDMMPGKGRYDVHLDLNVLSLPAWLVAYVVKAVAIGLVGLLAFLCRTPARDRRDSRLLGEVALVVLTMLFVSERSWKHHYVTILIPYCYLVAEFFSSHVGPRSRTVIVGSWVVSFSLIAATSTDLGGQFLDGQGHEIAQGYGLFLWAGVVVYATVAWRVWVRRSEIATPLAPSESTSPIPASHFTARLVNSATIENSL
jgi:alpha-1,2-mannosyltransferase